MEQLAFGKLKLKPTDFDIFSVRELVNTHKGYLQEREELEALTRQICFYVVAVQQGKERPIKKPDDLWQLSSEVEKNGKKKIKYATIERIKKE